MIDEINNYIFFIQTNQVIPNPDKNIKNGPYGYTREV